MPLTLNAFYDLSVSPAYYDFLCFLQIADIHRRRYDINKITIIFVPGPKEGFRNDEFRTTENNKMMMQNVLIPACHLLSSCNSINWLPNRELALSFLNSGNLIFPRDYTVDEPKPEYLDPSLNAAFLRGEVESRFTAPKDFHNQVKNFLKKTAQGKKPLTLTLREASHDSSERRLFNLPEWKKFLKEIDTTIYQPIIIRDTARTFADDTILSEYPHAPLASINILFRTALYEQSFINFFVNNGPLLCARFSASNYLSFKPIDDSIIATSTGWFQNILGIGVGHQDAISNINCRYAWDDDNLSMIKKHFYEMIKLLNSPSDSQKKHGLIDNKHATYIIASVVKEVLMIKFQRSIAVEDLQVIAGIEQVVTSLDLNFNIKDFIHSQEGKTLVNGAIGHIINLDKAHNVGLNWS
jgi:hypothetical protein